MNQFVYVKENVCQNGVEIKENEIGIVAEKGVNVSVVSFVSHNVDIELDNDKIADFDPSKTGDQFDKKVCNVCNRLLDVDMFQKNQNGKDNRTVRRPSCRACRIVMEGEDMTAEQRKQMNRIKPYMVIWTCPICKKTTVPGLTSKVVIDHDHRSGKPRAWICDSCNTGLGRFKDDTELLENAIRYLKEKEE